MSYLDMARSILHGLSGAEHGVVDAPCEISEISEIRSTGDQVDAEVVWRVAAFRDRISERGPVWPAKIRNCPETDTSGHCSLCGDALVHDPPPRFPRCQPCVTALWEALDMQREQERTIQP